MAIHLFIYRDHRPRVNLYGYTGVAKPFTYMGKTVYGLTEYKRELHDFPSVKAAEDVAKNIYESTDFKIVITGDKSRQKLRRT